MASVLLSGEPTVKARCLPFSQIPHTSALFSDFLASHPKIHPFYPRSPEFAEWLKEEAANISYDSGRRQQVAEILERQNRAWGASAETLANIDRLRRGANAVVTGQQVGLFGGPAFSFYKALTAVKLAQEATAAGSESVPIFWLATYDHDLAEVNHVALTTASGSRQNLSTPSHDVAGAPVSKVRLGEEIVPVLEEAAKLLGDSEIALLLQESYRPGESLGSAFARLFTRIFAEWGVILLDASDAELAQIAVPIFRAAVERADELNSALLARGQALEKAGYHQQVKVTPSSSLLFTLRDGVRTPIHCRSDSAEFVIGADADSEKIAKKELLARISSAPQEFSPNVLLRPVVEDYLLPTLAYTGGAAEVAYYAQAGVVYEALVGRVTPIIPRFSATVVEAKTQRLLEKHGLDVTDVFTTTENLRRRLAERALPQELQAAFETAKQAFDSSFSVLKEKLGKLDRTLVDAAETSRSKMQHQLEKLCSQAARAEAQKSEVVTRHAETLTESLFPDKNLQERGVAGISFLARYGREFLRDVYDVIRPDCHDHQILEIQESQK